MNNAYVHHVPGRLRVRAAAVRGSEEKAAAVKALLESTPGVRSVTANSLTGSVTIHYDRQVADHSKFTALLSERGYFVGPRVVASNYGVGTELGSVVATRVAKMVVGKAVETAIVALVTGLL